MSESLDIIKARHTRDGDNVVCWFCEMPWPCDTATVLAALAEAEQRAAEDRENADRLLEDLTYTAAALDRSEASQRTLREAVKLLHSMVLSGEKHSNESHESVLAALYGTPTAATAAPPAADDDEGQETEP